MKDVFNNGLDDSDLLPEKVITFLITYSPPLTFRRFHEIIEVGSGK
jgi:hypothetical protein